MRFIKSSLLAGLVVVVKSLASVIINKEIAKHYLPGQFALFAHFQNFLGVFLVIPSDGINRGLIKYLADENSESEIRRKIFIAGFILNLVVFCTAVLSILIFQDYFTTLFVSGVSTGIWITGICFALFMQLINLFFLSVLLARRQLSLYALINIISAVMAVVLVMYVAYRYSFSYALLATAIGPALLFFMAVLLTVKRRHLKEKFSAFKSDTFSYRQLGEFILMAVSVVLFGHLVDFFIRQYSMNTFSTYDTGLWQSVVKFSDYYCAAFTTILGMVYYPKISQLINNASALRKYVKDVLKISIPILIVGLLMIYFLREYILWFFFDEKFLAASFLFDFQLLGDFFKLISLLLSFLILAQARTVLFISVQAGSACFYILMIWLCTDQWAMEGFPIAHAIRFLFYLCFISIVYRKLIFS